MKYKRLSNTMDFQDDELDYGSEFITAVLHYIEWAMQGVSPEDHAKSDCRFWRERQPGIEVEEVYAKIALSDDRPNVQFALEDIDKLPKKARRKALEDVNEASHNQLKWFRRYKIALIREFDATDSIFKK